MKMDMNRTTTYMTTKKRIGCRAPKEFDLVLMIRDFGFQKNWIVTGFAMGKITC